MDGFCSFSPSPGSSRIGVISSERKRKKIKNNCVSVSVKEFSREQTFPQKKVNPGLGKRERRKRNRKGENIKGKEGKGEKVKKKKKRKKKKSVCREKKSRATSSWKQ